MAKEPTNTAPAVETSESVAASTNAPAKKAAAKKGSKKAAKPAVKKAKAPTKKATPEAAKKAAKKPAAKKAAKKPAKKAAKKPAAKAPKFRTAVNGPLFLERDHYNDCIRGLRAQGLDRQDAIETLKLGIRQANGRMLAPPPVPADLAIELDA